MHQAPVPVDEGACFDLKEIEATLRSEDQYQRTGQAARTLVRTDDMRIVVIVLSEGGRLAEHRAQETASIQVLSGQVRLALPDRELKLKQGQCLVLKGGLEHDVEAPEPAAILLTLGWTRS